MKQYVFHLVIPWFGFCVISNPESALLHYFFWHSYHCSAEETIIGWLIYLWIDPIYCYQIVNLGSILNPTQSSPNPMMKYKHRIIRTFLWNLIGWIEINRSFGLEWWRLWYRANFKENRSDTYCHDDVKCAFQFFKEETARRRKGQKTILELFLFVSMTTYFIIYWQWQEKKGKSSFLDLLYPTTYISDDK